MGLLDTTMGMAKLAGTLANPELVQEAMKANKEALDLSRENLELQKRVQELERQVKEMRALQDLKAELFVNAGYVFLEGDPNPRCLTCWDHSGKLIHVQPPVTGIFPQCTVCKNYLYVLPKIAPKRGDPGSVPVR